MLMTQVAPKLSMGMLSALWMWSLGFSALFLVALYALPSTAIERAAGFLSVPHAHCALCGMTRASICLQHGSIRAAAASNCGIFVIVSSAIANILLFVIFRFCKRPRRSS